MKFRNTIAVAAMFVLSCISANAQGDGTLRGRVLDQNQAVVPGATVTIKGEALQGERSSTTDVSGAYTLLGLPAGNYEMNVAAAGFAPFRKDGVQIRAAGTISYDITLGVEGVDQKVDVNADDSAPIIDTTNPEGKLNISGDFINNLPLGSTRSWDSIWRLVPGAMIPPSTVEGQNDPSVFGSSNRSNVYKLNGFDIANAATNQGWTTQFSTEIIKDVQIKTMGVDASTPLGEGGYINVTTQSGGNKFHGSAAVYIQPRKFNWTNIPGGTPQDQKLLLSDFSFGGPIIKDKTWFFASYLRQDVTQGIARTAATIAAMTAQGFPIPDYDLEQKNNRFFGKVTHQLNPNHTLAFSYLNDKGTTFNSDSREFSTVDATIDIDRGGATYIANWQANLSSKLLLTVNYGFRKIGDQVARHGGDSPSFNRYNTTVLSGGVPVGSGGIVLQYGNRAGIANQTKGERSNHEVTADLTYVHDGGLGQHTFQTGVQIKPKNKWFGVSDYPGSGLATVDEVRVGTPPNATWRPFHRRIYNPTSFTAIDLSTQVLGIYGMDKWNPFPQLTISYGLRLDSQKGKDLFGNQTLDDKSLAPRFGFAYSITKSGKDVVRGAYGRIHDVVYTQSIPGLGSRSPDFRDEYDADGDGVWETVRTTIGNGINTAPIVSPSFVVSPSLEAPYMDDFYIGYTRQLPWKLVLDVSYVDRTFKNTIGQKDVNIIYENGVFMGFRNVAPFATTAANFASANFSIMEYGNYDNVRQNFQAFTVTVNRNIGDKLSLITSYTKQRKTEKGTFRYDDVNGYLNPQSWFENDKLDRPHLFRANVSYRLPWDFNVSAMYELTGGVWGGALVQFVTVDNAAYPNVVIQPPPGAPAGTLPRTYTNPLRSSTRFLGPRSEGQIKTPSVPRLNARFGKRFRFADGRQSVEANVDFFNITNDDTPLSFFNGNIPVSATPFGMLSSARQAPRGAQLSFAYRF